MISNKLENVIIVGGGASGLMAAAFIDDGRGGTILESTQRIGTKLLISGSGQCNITHGGSIKDFPIHYGHNGHKFRSCLYKYSNVHLCDFLQKNKVPVLEREDGKIFPASLKSKEVLDLLRSKTLVNNFKIQTNSEVTSIKKHDSVYTVCGDFGELSSRCIIIATGGCSYPNTGSTGHMFSVLERDLNLLIENPKPALVPIKTYDYIYSDLAGISFDNCITSILENDRLVAKSHDSLLLTHKQFSGPAILALSRYASKDKVIEINYCGLSEKEVFTVLQSSLKNSKSSLETVISNAFKLPHRFSVVISKRSEGKTKEAARLLSRDRFLISGTGTFNEAMVTAGGVCIDQVNTKSMEANSHPGLYLIGEVLDIDGDTGGYNLQFCYSSANAAASAVKHSSP